MHAKQSEYFNISRFEGEDLARNIILSPFHGSFRYSMFQGCGSIGVDSLVILIDFFIVTSIVCGDFMFGTCTKCHSSL